MVLVTRVPQGIDLRVCILICSLARHLEKNSTIKQINIENNQFDDDLQDAIAAFVARNNKQGLCPLVF